MNERPDKTPIWVIRKQEPLGKWTTIVRACHVSGESDKDAKITIVAEAQIESDGTVAFSRAQLRPKGGSLYLLSEDALPFLREIVRELERLIE